MKERLQKLISGAGIASRRAAEELILAGRVCVNGVPASLGMAADPECDLVEVDGVPLGFPSERMYIMLNKPRGYLNTLSDERGRRTVAELVRGAGRRLYPVGRLDLNSEGLLIMTDDGEAACKEIDRVADRGATILQGRGGYGGAPKDVVLCACSNKQLYEIEHAIQKMDPASFIIMLQSNEVHGEGFRQLELGKSEENT